MSKIHAEDDKTIKDLLESNSLIFKIPINQRKYSWENDQLEMFWQDLNSVIINKKRHYLGVLSLIIKDSEDVNFNCYEIIDGQQRMTTIILLVSALRDIYCALNDENKSKKIQESYLCAVSTRKCLNKLEVSKIDNLTFSKLVNINCGDGTDILLDDCYEIDLKKNKCRVIDSMSNGFINKKMFEAYRYFYNEILNGIQDKNNEERKNYLLDIEEALSKFDIILIKSEDIESMFLFFESLNNRGLQLSKIDIVRNGLLKIVSERFNDSLECFGEMWDELVVNLCEHDEIKFLKYYFMCTNENKIIQAKELPKYYEEYFKSFNNKNDLKLEIEKMKKYSIIYSTLFTKDEVSTSDSEYIKNIKLINQLGQQACHSFLMEYIYWVKDSIRLNNITDLIEKMMFRRIICMKSTKQLDGIFRDLIKCRELNNSNKKYNFSDDKIKDIIIKNTPSDAEFHKMLKEISWDKNEIVSYFFRKLEYKISGNNSSRQFVIKPRKEVHVEHILPQNVKSEWAVKLNLQNDGATYTMLSLKLGNLILLEFDINTSIKDSLFNIKINKYKDSTLNQVKEFICKYEEWNENNINIRTDKLAEKALEIWSIN
ncbi:MAG: DUF262 domain-containing protein [Clostridium sartagoforme]|nr:DUF262 domain-containing protein [Clostridium sartagoforme]